MKYYKYLYRMDKSNLGIYTAVNIISNRSKIIARTNKTYANTSHLKGTDKHDPVTLAFEEYQQSCCPMQVKTENGYVPAKHIKYKV